MVICAVVNAFILAVLMLAMLSAEILLIWSVDSARTCAVESALSWSELKLLICAVEMEATIAVVNPLKSAASMACKLSELRLLI